MTYLETINKVLMKLRETQAVTVNDNEYIQLIGQFVNETKEEVEDAWNWLSLRETITISSTLAGGYEYSLTGAGDRYVIFSAFNNTHDSPMTKAPHSWMENIQSYPNVQEAPPFYYDIKGEDSNGDPTIVLWPRPDADYSLDFRCKIPQGDLTDGSTVIKAPWRPIYLGAYAMAIDERGDDQGAALDKAMMAYKQSLGDYIALDQSRTEYEDTWDVK
jgi:hypothetical protein